MNGKRFAMWVCAAAFSAVAFGGSSTNQWTDATVHDSIFNAADWYSVNSWYPASVPNDPTADAWLPNRTLYVTNSQPLSLYSIRTIEGWGDNCFVYVSDEPVSFYTIKQAYWRVGGGRFYAPVHFAGGGETYLAVVEFCGDVVCDDAASGPFGHSQKVEWRFDKFANAAGADRVAHPLDAALRSYDTFFSFYCPQSSATNVTYAYKLAAGSPYVKKVATAANPVIPAGTVVTGAGVPAGTFVKRVFPDWSLELSVPVTASADTTPLTFAAFTPNVYQYIRSFGHNGANCAVGLKAMKYRAEDRLEVEVDSLGLSANAGAHISFRMESGFLPGLITLHTSSSTSASGYPVELATCHLNFSTSTSKYGPGLPTAIVWQGSNIPKGVAGYNPAASVSRLMVTNGLSARIGCFTNLVGSVVKDGVGSLEIGLTNLVAANTGRLVAEAGRLAISSDTALEPSYVGTLAVSNGATFKLPAQGLRTSTFVFEPGAVIEGPGVLYVPEAHDGLQGLVFTEGARISFDKSTTVVSTQPETETVPGNPAFWVDCSNLDTLTYTTVNGSNLVSRINDVRKTSDDDGYLFSTNASGPDSLWKPVLRQEVRSGMHYVHFAGNYTNYNYSIDHSAGNPALSDTHVWSEPIRNIHVVFQAFEPSGNCSFLGATKNYSHYDSELNRYSVSYSGNIFDWAKTDLNYWDLAINGEPANNADGYPYPTTIPYATYAPIYRFVPFTMSLRVRPGAPAEAHPGANSYDYSATYSNQNRTGGKLLGELLVYTNDLTDVECQRITAYLMKKWNSVTYQYAPAQSDGNTLGAVGANLASAISVQAGKEVMAEAFIGEGTFAKNGDGGLFVKGVEPGVSLAVNGGTLEIRSRTLDAGLVPVDAYRWYDAEKLSAFTYAVDNHGVTNISSWADARGTAGYEATLKSSDSTNRPTLRAFAALGGKTAVDFGEVIRFENNASVDWTAAPSLVYTDSGVTLRTVIAVWGSEHGGGNLVGSPYAGHYLASEYTLVRAGGNTDRIGSDKNAAIIRGERRDMLFPTTARYPRGTRFQLNGERCDPNKTGLSGSFDLVSYVGYEPFASAGMSGVNNGPQWVGGEQFAEYLLFQRGLSVQEIADVEAYLNKKWFGRSTSGYEPAVLGDVFVAAGATLKITGNAPATVSSLAGSGTIDGEVVLANGASFTIEVAEDGSCSKLSVGTIDLSKPLTVNFTGYVRKFALGEHVVLESPSITAGMPLNWTVTGLARSRYCSFRAENGAVVGTVTSGLTISFR